MELLKPSQDTVNASEHVILDYIAKIDKSSSLVRAKVAIIK